ncbi:MAG: beta-N-acetylhexosaminidase [Pseudomonadota bacterium]|mgnify:CR=1 FL=1
MALGPLMLDVEGQTLSPVDRELIASPAVGGVILFKRNFESLQQVTELCAEIRKVKSPDVLIAVDQEGGRVQRFGAPFAPLPPLGFFGHLYDRDAPAALNLIRETGWLLAAELLSAGLDLSFAPVLDLSRGVSSVIGDRALHRNPEIVAELATAMMRGMAEAGMQATGKHFPGHGAVVADSHHELPVDRREYADITEDLRVFEQLVRAGLPAVMTAHVVYSELDPLPASFSPWWIGSELRQRIGFRGTVFSDDLTMKATLGLGDIIARADAVLTAGSDMLLVCNDRPAAERVAEHLADVVMPQSMARLARMRGTPHFDTTSLKREPRWKAAREALDLALERPPLELEF